MQSPPPSRAPSWFPATKRFERPVRWKAVFQLVNTLVPWFASVILAGLVSSSGGPWALTVGVGILAGGLQMRLFVLFHDCTHQSFWASRTANVFWGGLLGVLTFTPYRSWRKSHGIHHAHNGNLDRRGVGDVWTMTWDEYRHASVRQRLLYRVYRHPVFLILVIPPMLFVILHRLPERGASWREIAGSLMTSAACAGLLVLFAMGAGPYALLTFVVPMVYVATVGGVWLFYVQHQFDPGYWEHEASWNPYESALLGSSHYRLPRVLQWFSANIGLHHIHHLRPRIPNYRLEECYRATPELQLAHPMTIRESLKGLILHVWDEGTRELLTFREVRRRLRLAVNG